MKHLTGVLVGSAFATLGLCSIAQADTGLEVRSVTVRFEDLDATQERGAAALYRRLEHAAVTVCGVPTRDRGHLQPREAKCVQRSISGAVDDVNRPELTRYAAAHGVLLVPAGGSADPGR